jgi:hypothetical protein
MLNTSSQGQMINFNISIPNPKPTGKHLRVVLTWDSSPSLTSAINDLSDLDLSVSGDRNGYGSFSYGSNVEMVDIPASDLTVGKNYVATVEPYTMRIDSSAFVQIIYYVIAWTWVKDHAS